MRTHGFDWSIKRRLAKLAVLWGDGVLIADIAAALGTSEGSVIGRVRRLKLPKRVRLPDVWTPDLLVELKRLWAAGMDAAKIGVALGFGDQAKNKVIGAVHRHLDMPNRIAAKGVKMRPKMPHTFERKIHHRPDRRPLNVPAVPLDRRPTPLVDLGRLQCHFPLWDHSHQPGEPKLYCGAAVVSSTSWCASCLAVVAKPLEPRRRGAIR